MAENSGKGHPIFNNIEMGMGKNAQNTFATTAGMNLQSSLQDQQNQRANTLGWLGTGLNFLTGGLLGGGGGGATGTVLVTGCLSGIKAYANVVGDGPYPL